MKSFTGTITRCLGAVLLLLSASAAQAGLVISGGQLVGATDVDVNGTRYNVVFGDGTCISVFDGCDSNSDFALQDSTLAGAAAQALLDDVFLGAFDDDPELTMGCTNTSDCFVYIPYMLNSSGSGVLYASAINWALNTNPDNTGTGQIGISVDSTDVANLTYARFTLASVPEPATMWLLTVGLLGLTFFRLRRNLRRSVEASRLLA